MLQNIFITVLLFVFSGIAGIVFGQTPDAAIKPTYYVGDVAAISAGSITIAAKTGPVQAMLTEKTTYRKVSAEPFKNIDLSKATAGALADIGVGDKVTASALLASDGKAMNARTVYYVTKSDIAAKASAESDEWRKRGITGRVASVNSQTNQVQVDMTSLMGKTTLVLTPNADAKFMRYAPGSVRYDEALKSSLNEIKVGDEIRALGEKSTDGSAFAAEKVLTGAFQTLAGTIKSIDSVKNEIILDLQKGKTLKVVVTDTSIVKRYPAEMAERMAAFQAGGAGVARPPSQGGQSSPQVNSTSQTQPARSAFGGQGGPRAGGLDDMFMRFPDIKIADLKVGDVIAVVITKSDATSAQAIKLAAGVEPFIRMAQASGGGQRGQGVQGGFSIPGLDGISF